MDNYIDARSGFWFGRNVDEQQPGIDRIVDRRQNLDILFFKDQRVKDVSFVQINISIFTWIEHKINWVEKFLA